MSFHCAFTIRSDTRYLAVLRDFVRAAAKIVENGRISHIEVQAICVALTEAVDNSIIHAHKRKKSLPIRIALSFCQDRAIISIDDTGGGIGEFHLHEPRVTACRGRGLFIMRRVMNRVVSHAQKGGHKLRMVLCL